MAKSYFVTLGFNETYLLRLLTETSAQKDDELVIVVPSPIAEGTKVAIENLKINNARLNYPIPKVHEITLADFTSILSQLIDILLPLPEPVISELSIGMRLLNSLILLSILLSGKKFFIYVRDESGGSKVVSFSYDEVYSLMRELSKEEEKMLSLIKEKEGITPSELAIELKKSEKTVLNKISELKKLGYVTMKGKSRSLELTPLGAISLKLHGKAR